MTDVKCSELMAPVATGKTILRLDMGAPREGQQG